MENGRIVELLPDILVELREMKQEQQKTSSRLETVENRLEKLEEQQARTNVQLFELRGDIIRLAERTDQIIEHERRIARLESTVYNYRGVRRSVNVSVPYVMLADAGIHHAAT